LFAFADRFERDWALTSAASEIMILPVLVVFLSMQGRFIAGLTHGGLKA
jgi:raffinose/stachyose/melibiose transport system permease protein